MIPCTFIHEESKAALGKRRRKGLQHVLLLIGIVLVCSLAIACSKEKKGSVSSSSSGDSTGMSALLPQNTIAYLQWDTTIPAYKKFASSPWSSSTGASLESLAQQNEGKLVTSVLKDAGVDLNDRTTMESIFSRGVFFITPADAGTSTTERPFRFSTIIEAQDEKKFNALFSTLKTELKKDNRPVEDVSVENGSGFRVTLEQDKAPAGQASVVAKSSQEKIDLFFSWAGKRGIISSDASAGNKYLAAAPGSGPAFMASQPFQKVSSEVPPADQRFAFGYADITSLAPAINMGDAAGSTSPLQGAGFAMGFSDTPSTAIRIAYDEKAPDAQHIFAALKSSSSSNFLKTLDSSPLLFLSLDGASLRGARDAVATQLDEQTKAQYQQPLASLDDVTRFGLVARMSPVGQSMLPVPDLMFLIESSNAAATESNFRSLVSEVAGASGAGAMAQWQEKDINGRKVPFIMSPLGIGAYLAREDNLVIVASTEAQLRSALGALGGDGSKFASALTSNAKEVLSTTPTVGNLYLDFMQIAAFLENMGGLLQMYAPQNDGTKELLKDENLKNLKQMGTLVGSLRVEPGMLGIDSFYQQPAPAHTS